MVIKRDIESLFQPDENGRIQISQEAPTVLKTAINEAEKRLKWTRWGSAILSEEFALILMTSMVFLYELDLIG